MQITFSPEIDRFIQSQVESGAYASPSELISAAVRLLMEAKPEEWTLEALRAAVAIGAAEAERGEFAKETISDMIATMEARYPKENK